MLLSQTQEANSINGTKVTEAPAKLEASLHHSGFLIVRLNKRSEANT